MQASAGSGCRIFDRLDHVCTYIGGDMRKRAIDEQTGKELWHAQLPATSQAMPAVYEANGREYLVIRATAGGGFGGGGRGTSLLPPAQPAYVV